MKTYCALGRHFTNRDLAETWIRNTLIDGESAELSVEFNGSSYLLAVFVNCGETISMEEV